MLTMVNISTRLPYITSINANHKLSKEIPNKIGVIVDRKIIVITVQ